MWLGSALGALFAGATYLLFVLPHSLGNHRFDAEGAAGLLVLLALVLAVLAGMAGVLLQRLGGALHDTEVAGPVYRRLAVPARR